MSHILAVSDLTRALKDVLEAEFPFVWVRGQVTNLARPASGHLYFTLSDAEAQLAVVWFKGSQGRGGKSGPGAERIDPLTGEVLEPGMDTAQLLTDGQEVLVAGRISVYAPRGNYQLIAELVQPAGISGLAAAFEALKRKLADKGLFDEARKKPIPQNPARVALITSPQGAAVRDFLRLAEARGTGAQLRIYPALVQGDAAPGQIAAQLDAVNREGWAEVIALIRGGGSLEDLWAFNTEAVAEAMARSAIPVVTGVGHEPDVSIADYVADKRFSTPSAVATGLWPLRADLMQAVDGLEADLARAFGAILERRERQVAELSRALTWLSPVKRVERLEQGWREASQRLLGAGERYFEARGQDAANALRGLLRSFGPAAVDARAGQTLALTERLRLALDLRLAEASRRAEVLGARLAGLDPEAPLSRGYSLVHVLDKKGAPGRLLRAAAEVSPGDRLRVRTGAGDVAAIVAAAAEPVAEEGAS
ncbi:MAG TPA: exodeoxyribonuclease VII large subunit [Humidesulfovibrio sp.]|uniref:exodeoxyribonuclease VII large subunit n=1 Tax=Humidesulfovibrio sp. TaxID=2910988 RepID=UPI002C65CBF8|nr:exodeoxyribonuclease VII large subunit [Humidesulfovibrio sp.]HWR04009.1 exodeoxyribonuclease VII large subunit [Humidesulfovibrio sp.]